MRAPWPTYAWSQVPAGLIPRRNPEVRPVLLERGTEGVLRRVKLAFPGPPGALVRDCASAALRDLGCDNYND